jgi:hypothetical protein
MANPDSGCGANAGVPGRDGAVQIGKDKASGIAISQDERGACIGDLAGGALGSARRCWDCDCESIFSDV